MSRLEYILIFLAITVLFLVIEPLTEFCLTLQKQAQLTPPQQLAREIEANKELASLRAELETVRNQRPVIVDGSALDILRLSNERDRYRTALEKLTSKNDTFIRVIKEHGEKKHIPLFVLEELSEALEKS